MNKLLFAIVFSLLTFYGYAQECASGSCTNFTNQYPSTTFSTTLTSWTTVSTSMNAGNWTLFSVTSGNTYEWTYCSTYGGSSSNWDPQLTLYDYRNPPNAYLLCYSDDDCGTAPYIRWTASFSGTVLLLTSKYNCQSNTGSPYNKLVWRKAPAPTYNLAVTVRNINNATVSNAKVILYNSNWSVLQTLYTNGSGVATFSGLVNGTYNYEVYYTPSGTNPPISPAEEFWGSRTTSISNTNRSVSFTRDQPIFSSSATFLPSSLPTGQATTGTFQVRNPLSYSTQSYVRIFVDRSNSSPWDYTNNSQSSAQTINSGNTNSFNFNVTPSNTGTYNYYAFVYSWVNSQYIITDQYTWTTAFTAVTPLPDLYITPGTQDLSNYSPTMGSTITAYASEDNNGSAYAGANVVSIHLSSNNVLTPGQNGDTYLGEINMPSLAPLSNSLVYNTNITIPCNINPGTYYIFFSADGGGVVTESNENNNQATRQITISTSTTDTYEPNNSSSSPSYTLPLLSFNSLTTNRLSYIFSNGDVDWYYFGVDWNGIITIDLTSLPDDYDLALYNSSGALVAQSNNLSNISEQIVYSYTLPMSTWFYIRVIGYNGAFNKCDSYNLGLTWNTCLLEGASITSNGPGNTANPPTITITTGAPIFSWNSVPNATSYSIYLRDVTTNDLFIYDCATTSTSWTLPSCVLVDGHSYRWNMRASDATCESCYSNYSQLLYFDVDLSPSSASASIGSPANGTEHYTNVSCVSVSGVTGYSYDYSLDGSNWNVNWFQTTSNNINVNNGDSPNAPFYYRVRTYCGSNYSGYLNASPQPIYTACDVPAIPTVNGATLNSLNITLNAETPVANPNYTTYAIYCSTTSQYVQSNGSLGSTAYYQTKAGWGTKTVTGLAPNSPYCFYAIAKNIQNDTRFNSANYACGITGTMCAPYFLADPDPTTVCTNSTAHFYVTATSSSNISYQWKKGNTNLSNGSKYQGVNTNHLIIYNCISGDAGNYSCVATACSTSTQSNSASLSVSGTVSPDPNFHSSDNNINAGEYVTLSANNPCGGCSYSWEKTGGTFVGSNTGSSVLLYFPTPGTFTFKLTVTGPSCNPITRSSTGFVTVRPTPNVQAEMPVSHVIWGQYPSGYEADPINLATGTYGFSRTLSKFKVIGGELQFTAFYNSYATNYTAANMGTGWSHSFDYRIYRQADDDPLNPRDTIWRVHYPDLHETDFIVLYQGGGRSFPLHHGVFDELTEDTVARTFQLRTKDQIILNFDSAGVLQSIVDRNNNVTTLTYNAGKLSSVTGPGGRAFNFNYAGELLTSITDPTEQFTFSYTGNDLTSMSDGEGNNTTFTYNAFHEMENVRNPLGNYLLKNIYLNHKVDTQEDGNSNITSFEYNNPTSGATTVNYPDGSNSIFYHDTLFRLIRHEDEANFNTYTVYDYNHLPVSITDVSGFVTTALYDSVGNQKEVHKPHGINIFRQYNATNDITQVIDGEGNVTSYNRDARGNILNINRPGNNDESFTYSPQGQILTQINGRNIPSSFSHNSFGDLVQVNAPKGVWYLRNDGKGRNISILNPLGDSTRTTYDGNDNVLVETDEEGYTVTHVYDINQNEVSLVDKNNHPTTLVYDAKDRLHIIRNIQGGEQKIDYNLRDVKKKFTDERDKYVEFTVTERGDITNVRNKLGGITNVTQRDNAGNPIAFTNASGVSVTRVLDSLYREKEITIGGIVNNKKDFNRNNQIAQYIDGRGNPKTVQFDALNRPENIVDEEGNPTVAVFDGNNNMVSLTDPNGSGHTTTTIFDTEDNDSLTTDANGLTEKKLYNAVGELTKLIKPHVTVDFSYYKNHRLKDAVYSTGESFHFVYDGNGNITDATGPNGVEHYVYDNLNRPTSYTDFRGNAIEYTYDATGNPLTIKYPGNKLVQYTYNDIGQVASVTAVWVNKTWSFEYDTPGNLLKINYPNNYKAELFRDPAGRVEKYRNYNATTQQTIYQDSLWRDGNANVDSNAVNGWWADSLAHGYLYYQYQNNNVMLSDGQSNFTHNNHGALVQQSNSGGAVNYTWSANDVLMAMNSSGNSVSFNYDVFFRLTGQIKNGYETRYVNDISQPLHRVIMTQNAAGTATGYYIYGDGLVGMIDSAGNLFNYHYDVYGNTMFLTNEAGVVTDKYTYADPWGTLYKHEGTSNQPFLFLGKYGIIAINDSLYNIRARYYQSTTNRFLSKDPYDYDILSSQSIHRYVYGLNNPLVYKDITGWYGQIDDYSGSATPGLDKAIAITTFIKEGRYLGTGYVQDAYNYYENLYINNYVNGKSNFLAGVGLAFTSLWTPQTYETTAGAFSLGFDYSGKELTKLIGKTGYLKLIDMRTSVGIAAKKLYGTYELIDDSRLLYETIRRYNKVLHD